MSQKINLLSIGLRFAYGKMLRLLPDRLRWPPEYHRMVEFLYRSENWTPAEQACFQYDSMRSLLQYAEENISWYQKSFAEHGVSSRTFVNLEDIQKFPTVSKEDIRDHLEDFVSTRLPRRSLIYTTTGGSTGIPCGFFQTQSQLSIERAFFGYHWGWFDCKLDDLSVVFRGGFVGTESQPFLFRPSRNEWHFSVYFLSGDRLQRYVDRLNSIKPRFIQAYPSAIDILAQFLLETDQHLDFELRAVMCGSENTYPAQIDRIEKAFGTHVHAWYGQAEKVCMAVWTRTSRSYHVLPQYGLTELVHRRDVDFGNVGEAGEIVATGFHNYGMPLIRYKTRDMAIEDTAPSAIGPHYRRFKRIDGRLQEMFVADNGRLISMTAMNMHDNVFDCLSQFQFHQDTPGVLVMKAVPKSTLSAVDQSRIEQRIREKVGADTVLSVEVVREIPRTQSGKLRFLVQKLPIPQWPDVRKADRQQ